MDIIFPLALKMASKKYTEKWKTNSKNDRKLDSKCILNDRILTENYEPSVFFYRLIYSEICALSLENYLKVFA